MLDSVALEYEMAATHLQCEEVLRGLLSARNLLRDCESEAAVANTNSGSKHHNSFSRG